MTTITKTIGRLPQYVGDWEQRTSPNGYKRRNRVTMFGSEFESLVDNNTQVPATYNSQTGVITVNTTYWKVISNALGAYVIDQQWPAKEQEMQDFMDGVDSRIAGKLNASEKAAANGVASLDSNTKVPIAQLPTGANGLATLDNAGKVPSSQLPSYVDDVIEGYYYGTEDPDTHEITYNFYSDSAHTQLITPESGKIYIDIPNDLGYRWSGSQYFPISNPDVYTKSETYNKTEVNTLVGSKQDTITDMKQLGCGYITCSTQGGTQAKVASLQGFTLLTGSHITVYFIYGFTTTGSTLNINETGAKPIYLYGSSIAPHKVHDHCVLSMVYDGTQYDVTSILYMGESMVSGAVDLDLPSGILWCDHNVGAASPEATGLFFSWGNVQGHAEGSGYDFSQSTYNGTSGAALSSDISVGDTYDMARHNMGSPWRLPTKDDFVELYDNCDKVWIEQNGMNGIRFTSRINGNSIFFPAAGNYYGTVYSAKGSSGNYWASSYKTSENAYDMAINNSGAYPEHAYTRYLGYTIRAVQ